MNFPLAVVVGVSLGLMASSFAAEKSDSPPPAPTQKIVVSKGVELLNALVQVTGLHDDVVGQGSSQRVMQVPYNFSADTIWAMTDDITILRVFVTSAQETLKKMQAQAEAKNGGPLKPKKDAEGPNPAELSDAQIALNKETQDFMDSEKPIDKLFRIHRADLKIGENHIPGVTLSIINSAIVDP